MAQQDRYVTQPEIASEHDLPPGGNQEMWGVAVLAENSWSAIQGRSALEIVWDEGPNAGESSELLHKQFIENAAKPGKVVRNEGDADGAIAAAGKKVEATYEFPFAAHATMEPMNCTVYIRPDGAEAWVPTQAPQ